MKGARTQVVSNVNLNRSRWCIFKLKSHTWFRIKPHLFRWHWKAYTLTFGIKVTYVWYTIELTYNKADKKGCHKEFVDQLSLPRKNRGWLGKFIILKAFYHAKWKHQTEVMFEITVWSVIQLLYSPNGSRSLAKRAMLKIEKCTTLQVWGEIRQPVQIHLK